MRTEVEALLRPAGIGVAWRVLHDRIYGESFPMLTVMRLHGKCSGGAPPVGLRSGALGGTHMTDGVILPFLNVDCDLVRGYVSPELATQERCNADLMLGRALGRVVAHELFHVLTRTARHGRSGLTKARFSVSDLVGPGLALERAAAAQISRAVAARHAPARADVSPSAYPFESAGAGQ